MRTCPSASNCGPFAAKTWQNATNRAPNARVGVTECQYNLSECDLGVTEYELFVSEREVVVPERELVVAERDPRATDHHRMEFDCEPCGQYRDRFG